MAPDLLDRIDRIMAELAELRAAVAASVPAPANGADDFAPHNLVEISTAVERWNRPADTLRLWCRKDGDGVKVGGRWLASAPRVQRRLKRE